MKTPGSFKVQRSELYRFRMIKLDLLNPQDPFSKARLVCDYKERLRQTPSWILGLHNGHNGFGGCCCLSFGQGA